MCRQVSTLYKAVVNCYFLCKKEEAKLEVFPKGQKGCKKLSCVFVKNDC